MSLLRQKEQKSIQKKEVKQAQVEKQIKPSAQDKTSQKKSEKSYPKRQTWGYCNDTSCGPHSLVGF